MRAALAVSLAFGSVFLAEPAQADWQSNNVTVNGNTVQFTYTWGWAEQPVTNATIVIDNTITNKIGWDGEIIDTFRIYLDGELIDERTEKGVFTYNLTGQLRVEGIDNGFWAGYYGPIVTVSESEPEVIETPAISESPVIIEPPVVIPPPPTSQETEEIAETVIDDYAAFWAKYGLNEADYSQDSRVQTYQWLRAQYDQLIAEKKISKSLTAALSMRSQVRIIEDAYLAGNLKANPVEVIAEPSPEPVQPEPTPEPTPSESPIVESESSIVPTESNEVEPTPQPSTESYSPKPTANPEPVLPKPEPTKPEPSATPLPVVTEAPIIQPPSESEEIEAPTEPTEEIVEKPEETKSDSVSAAVETSSAEAIGAVVVAVEKLLDTVTSAGLDMTPEKREEAQQVVVASIIVSQVASAASITIRKNK